MAKQSKLSTPDWIKEGYDSKADYNKAKGIKKEKKIGKTFRIRKCPKCGGDDIGVLLVGEEGKKAENWECRQCKWKGKDVAEEELSEEEFMKYLDERGEEVP